MISKRIIPVFLLQGKRLVKGTRFDDFTDVGDPLSQTMIYDAQGADEIFFVDITASREGRTVDPDLIYRMIYQSRLPIAAGGGIRNVKEARRCFEAGADKIVVNTHAVLNPSLVKALAEEFGSQSVVVSIDVKQTETGSYVPYVFSGGQQVDTDFECLLKQLLAYGAGEIMLTAIDREGTLKGFDIALYRKARSLVNVPLIASGGAGCFDDIVALFQETDCDAAGIGKMFFLRDYDVVKIKSYLTGRKVGVRDA